MLKRYSSPINQSIGLAVMLLLLVGAAFISYACYGPYYSPDTVNYFDFSQNILKDSLWRQIYSPLYPFVLHFLSAFPFLSLYDGAHLLILLQYGVGVYFLFLWTNITAKHTVWVEKNSVYYCYWCSSPSIPGGRSGSSRG